LLVQNQSLPSLLVAEHKGAALGLAVAADGGQILHGILLQKFYDFIHDFSSVSGIIGKMACTSF
jgi:hypothetical protein